jgi:RNA polymerase sigma-70 factor (ECF subfamily)
MSNIDNLRKGVAGAFEEAFNGFHRKLYFFFLKHTGDQHQAEELVQVTFIKLWLHRQRLSYEHTLSEQVFRIAKTSLIDAFRKARTEQKVLQEVKQEQDHQQEPVTENIFTIDLSDQLEKGIHAMPPVQQKVFLLSRYEGLSNKEIASHLSISPKTVERHITKALRLLREVMVSIFLY